MFVSSFCLFLCICFYAVVPSALSLSLDRVALCRGSSGDSLAQFLLVSRAMYNLGPSVVVEIQKML